MSGEISLWKARQRINYHSNRVQGTGVINTLTLAEWIDILLRSQGHCHYCRELFSYDALTLDHVVPIARGGSNSADNVVVACRDCNASKGASQLNIDGKWIKKDLFADDTRVTIKLYSDVHYKLKVLAAQMGMSINDLIELLVTEAEQAKAQHGPGQAPGRTTGEAGR